jgi:hypothetical protein
MGEKRSLKSLGDMDLAMDGIKLKMQTCLKDGPNTLVSST